MSKNPEIKRHRTVYFNLDEPNDAALNNYIESLGVKFSGYVKGLIFQDQLNRSQGGPINPYQISQAYINSYEGVQAPIKQETRVPKAPTTASTKVKSNNNAVADDEELPSVKDEEPEVIQEPMVLNNEDEKDDVSSNSPDSSDDLSSVVSRQAAQIQKFVRTRPNRNRN